MTETQELKQNGYSKFIFILNDEMKEKITTFATDNGLKQAEVVRMAIDSFFKLPTKRKLIAKLNEILDNIK